jgi:hypothetical protein
LTMISHCNAYVFISNINCHHSTITAGFHVSLQMNKLA